MQTTIEIPDHMRAQLLEIASRRGLQGFSAIVQEALAGYLQTAQARSEAIQAAQAVLGTMTDEEADSLEASAREARRRWR